MLNKPMKADLHCHSRVSDGSIEIRELVSLARKSGVMTLAIVDHDTVDGLAEAETAGKEYGVKIISGIEISAFDYQRGRKAHVLGFLMDHPQQVGEACRPTLNKRQKTSEWIVETLFEAGYLITWDFVKMISSGSTNVYKQHIMHALMELGYTSALKGDLYKKLFAKPSDAASGGIAYSEIEYIDVFEAVKLIKKAGGVAVLAHPIGYKNMELIPELIEEAGLDGLEAWHPSHDDEAVNRILAEAEKYGLILTGGSDFHGMYDGKPNLLGSCNMSNKWIQRLYELKASQKHV
ncbi:PHP domain-containing protein [Desulfosporosinus fructosivorans]|uniref:PHP domain-containing protein n=1 Tax=Desulfosporosinus fructosivorans TaxID=2018669 RepID=A0A4Z0RAV6_9FIRM|nr:PHP domain-containing protein [Desulfosporosinus fructosivorans]TGE38736.1 PHP domain-containing protein [Desulfosporosinus fructosivorans]